MSVLLQGGVVFWFLCGLGLLSIAIFFERLLHMRRAQINYGDFLKGVWNVLENGHVEEAMMLCEETPGPVAAVVLAAIRHHQGDPEAMHRAVDTTGRAELSRLERRLASLAVICQVAPLIGLFGTLTGVIQVVLVLNEQAPVVQSVNLTGGVMQATLAAAAGIMVAIPCHAMYALLMSRVERIVLDMEVAAAEILAYLTQHNTPLR